MNKVIREEEKVIVAALQEKRFKDAERHAVEWVKIQPLHAQGWVFLGESLMLQGFKETAKKVFDRALLLDPEATWTEGVYSTLSRLKEDMPRIDIEMMMELAPVTVTAAIIVRNEQRCIARCLESLSGAVDEIVVVDTGSTDKTIDMIRQFQQVKLYFYEWNDDFASARNELLRHVTTDWVICVDADEYLVQEDSEAIRQAAMLYHLSSKPSILQIGRLNTIEGTIQVDYNESRMFQMNKQLRYWGRAHAQIGGAEGIYSGDYVRAAVKVRFIHDGYEPGIMLDKGKMERRLRQTKAMTAEDPDHPGWWFFYGRELWQSGNKEQALEMLLKAEHIAQSFPEFGRKLEVYMLLAAIYLSDGLLDKAEAVCKKALEEHPDFPDAHFNLGIIECKRSDQLIKDSLSAFKLAKSNYPIYRGSVAADAEIDLWKADEGIAEAMGLSGNREKAKAIIEQVRHRKRRRGEQA